MHAGKVDSIHHQWIFIREYWNIDYRILWWRTRLREIDNAATLQCTPRPTGSRLYSQVEVYKSLFRPWSSPRFVSLLKLPTCIRETRSHRHRRFVGNDSRLPSLLYTVHNNFPSPSLFHELYCRVHCMVRSQALFVGICIPGCTVECIIHAREGLLTTWSRVSCSSNHWNRTWQHMSFHPFY
jgi:hypothetical protein